MRLGLASLVCFLLVGCAARRPAPYAPAPAPAYDSSSYSEPAPAQVNGECFAACTEDNHTADQCNSACLGKTDADIDQECLDECTYELGDEAYCRGDCMYSAAGM